MLGHTDRNGLAHMLTILLACPILTQWAETHIASWPEYPRQAIYAMVDLCIKQCPCTITAYVDGPLYA